MVELLPDAFGVICPLTLGQRNQVIVAGPLSYFSLLKRHFPSLVFRLAEDSRPEIIRFSRGVPGGIAGCGGNTIAYGHLVFFQFEASTIVFDFSFVAMVLIAVLLLAFAGYLAYAWPIHQLRRNLRFMGFQDAGNGRVTLRFEHADGSIQDFLGSCTVWRSMPSGRRCNTQTEGFLFEIWAAQVRQPGASSL